MDEFQDFFLNSIPGLSEQPGPIIQGAGGKVLDFTDEPMDTVFSPERPSANSLNNQTPAIIEADTLILGPVRRSPPITSGPVDLSFAVERYYMDVRDGFRITSRGRLFADGAHTRFVNLYKWLKKHAAIHGEIDLFHVSDLWLKDFIHFLHHQNLSLNTVSGYVDNLHSVINNMSTDGLTLPTLTMRVSPEAANAVFNSEEELQLLLDTTYSHEALSICRDIFVMQSYLGFRVGTLQLFLREPQLYLFYEKNRWFIQIRTNKTGFIVTVPVKNVVLDILERRNYVFEPVYYERYYNSLIKMFAREAGLIYPVPYSITYGNKRREFRDPKCEMMASHTARRNFATNAFLAGVPVESIMWVTGHTTREAFLGYIRCDSRANAFAMVKHPFFA